MFALYWRQWLESEILFLFCAMDPVSHTFICYPTFLPNSSLREVLLWVRTQVQNRIVQVISSGDCGGGLGVGVVGMWCISDSGPSPSKMTHWWLLPLLRFPAPLASLSQGEWGPVMVRLPHHSTSFYSQLRPRAPLRVLLLIKCVTKLLGYKNGGISQDLSFGSSIIKIWLIVPQYLSFGESLTKLKINHLTQFSTTTQNLKMFTAAIWLLFKIAKKWKQLKHPSADGQTNKMSIHITENHSVGKSNEVPIHGTDGWSLKTWERSRTQKVTLCVTLLPWNVQSTQTQRQKAVKELPRSGRDARQTNCRRIWSWCGGDINAPELETDNKYTILWVY